MQEPDVMECHAEPLSEREKLAFSCCTASVHLIHSAYFLSRRQALLPPKPNEFDIAARTFFAFALFGT